MYGEQSSQNSLQYLPRVFWLAYFLAVWSLLRVFDIDSTLGTLALLCDELL
jgi:hypothetical protein